MEKTRGNIVVVSINKALNENREENIKLLEKQMAGIVFDKKKSKCHFSDIVNTECKIHFCDRMS